MKLTIGFLFWILLAGVANAQVIIVDFNKATMSWTWTPGAGETASGFRMKCGNKPSTYSIITDLPGPATTVAVKSVIGGSGTWFCAASAYNQFGETPMSNEVNFVAGVAPSGIVVLTPPQ